MQRKVTHAWCSAGRQDGWGACKRLRTVLGDEALLTTCLVNGDSVVELPPPAYLLLAGEGEVELEFWNIKLGICNFSLTMNCVSAKCYQNLG